MRVTPSRPENLARGGVSLRVYTDTRTKLRELCAIRGGIPLARCLDQVVDETLQRAYDAREEGEPPTLGGEKTPP